MAVGLFQKAVSLDPNSPRHGPGWPWLSTISMVLDRPGALTLEMEAAEQAQKLRPTLRKPSSRSETSPTPSASLVKRSSTLSVQSVSEGAGMLRRLFAGR